jgi:hypothetical protein
MMALIASSLMPERLRPGRRPLMAMLLLLSLAMILSGSALALNQSENQSAAPLIDAFSCQYNCSGNDPLSSLEELLRDENRLFSSFEIMLNKTNTTIDETIAFLDSFEDLLRRQTVLYSGFESLLKSQWYRLDCQQQRIFLDSFEDLLKRETYLISRFADHINASLDLFPPQNQTKLLASYEDLLRRQTKLFKSYEELYKMTNGGLSLHKHVNKDSICRPGEMVEYWYVVKNWCNQTITNVSIVDDHLGIIAQKITLGPHEERTFNRTVCLSGTTCNTAKAYGEGPGGEMLVDESNTVCVNLILVSGKNIDSLVIGKQYAIASGSDPPEAINSVEIKKNQKSGARLNNTEIIRLEGQLASSISGVGIGGKSGNSIKIDTNQGWV